MIFEEGLCNHSISGVADVHNEGENFDDVPATDPTTPYVAPPLVTQPPSLPIDHNHGLAPIHDAIAQASPEIPAALIPTIDAPALPRRSTHTCIPTTAVQDSNASEIRIADATRSKEPWAMEAGILDYMSQLNSPHQAFYTTADESWIPRNARDALTRLDLWKAPMDDEMEHMKERKVWRLIERPPGARTMKNKWVFTIKYDGAGKFLSRKARLVAKGFSQIPGVDFFESFASVVRFDSLRAMISIGAARNMVIWQVDYTSAYLNARTQVPILMEQPARYEVTPKNMYEMSVHGGEKVLDGEGETEMLSKELAERLKNGEMVDLIAEVDKAIYGTINGAANWWRVLDTEMTRIGFYRSRADQSVRWKEVNGELTVTSTYTDDVTGLSTTEEGALAAKKELGEKYELKDLGHAKFVLGIQIERDKITSTVSLSQSTYLTRVLEKHGMANCAPQSTPLPLGIILTKAQAPSTTEEREYMADKPYREVLGAIMYAQLGTRPDLSFAVSTLSRFASCAGVAHWKAMLHVLQYIKGTLNYKLTYGGTGCTSITPYGFTDSDYGGDTETRCSVSGYVFIQAGGPTAWGTKYQPTIAMSTTEAEYMAMSRAAQQLQWMYASLSEMGMPQPRPACLFADNTGAIALSTNSWHNARVKHIDVCHHFIWELVDEGELEMTYVPITENLADLFMKPLGRIAHHKFCVAL